jgi:S-adenosylmethionine decarboxylase
LNKQYETRGTHHILDCYGVDFDILDNLNELTIHMTKAIELAGMTIVGLNSKKFNPQGCTVIFLLEESHFSAHSSPEHGYIGIDCFTCGDADPKKAIEYMVEVLKPKEVESSFIIRGVKGSRGVQL